jgi:dihydrofolate synthase/folylpolyglutamate synthase
LDKKKIIKAVEGTQWEGRLEVICRRPLVILDGAHNEEGADSLRVYLRDIVRRPAVLVFAAMKDKNIRKMADLIFPLAEKIVLTRVPMERAATPEEILAVVKRHRGDMIIEPDVGKAMKTALRESRGRTPIIVAGSLFLVGEVKKLRPVL